MHPGYWVVMSSLVPTESWGVRALRWRPVYGQCWQVSNKLAQPDRGV